MKKKNNFGKSFNQFKVDDKIKHWPRKTISETEHSLFCMITMNHHPIHIDKLFAQSSKFKKRLVVGTYVFSLVVGMSVRDISGKAIANLNYENINHLAPVFLGDTITASSIILKKESSKSNSKNGKVKIFTSAKNQKNKEVLNFVRNILIKKNEN
jgi:acyl dehydratase